MKALNKLFRSLFNAINYRYFTNCSTGIGVPILLAYVYGVVPISLCRSGGCGVTTTNSGGVRFEFDDNENGQAGGTTLSPGNVVSISQIECLMAGNK